MKKIALALILVPSLLMGCQSTTAPKTGSTMTISKESMLHRNWVLTQIDGQPLQLPQDTPAPNLEIGENFTANGHAGCNRYFGQGELTGSKFRIDKMATTMMACPEPAMKVESLMSNVLSDWSEITMSKQTLELKNAQHTLTFQLRDWVN